MSLAAEYQRCGELDQALCLGTAHGWKVFEEFIDPLASFNVVEERSHWDAGPAKHRRATQDVWAAFDQVGVIGGDVGHARLGLMLAQFRLCGRGGPRP